MSRSAWLTPSEREALALGRHYFESGDSDAALVQLSRVLRTRRDYADVHYMVGLAHERRGDLEQASRSLEEALRINPGYAEARLALATLHERRGDFDRSRTLAETATTPQRAPAGAIDPTTRGKLANLHAAVADAYREAGDAREAVLAYRKALDRCPDFHDIRHRLGVALREAGLPHQAIQEFRRILRANPEHRASAVQLGVTWYTLGRVDDAVRLWRSVLDEEPARADARMYLRLVGPEAPAGESA